MRIQWEGEGWVSSSSNNLIIVARTRVGVGAKGLGVRPSDSPPVFQLVANVPISVLSSILRPIYWLLYQHPPFRPSSEHMNLNTFTHSHSPSLACLAHTLVRFQVSMPSHHTPTHTPLDHDC
jgi:hypothetical protein